MTLTRPQFERFVAGLTKSALRAKGTLYLEEDPDHRIILKTV